eukprot:COSAG02_NODE_1640_length_11532_cov_5.629406_2_plen_66_part_00
MPTGLLYVVPRVRHDHIVEHHPHFLIVSRHNTSECMVVNATGRWANESEVKANHYIKHGATMPHP